MRGVNLGIPRLSIPLSIILQFFASLCQRSHSGASTLANGSFVLPGKRFVCLTDALGLIWDVRCILFLMHTQGDARVEFVLR